MQKITIGFTKEQAFQFGRHLCLQQNKLEELADKAQSNRGMDIVLHIFDFIERATTNFDDSKVEEINEALYQVIENSQTPLSSEIPKCVSFVRHPSLPTVTEESADQNMVLQEINSNDNNTCMSIMQIQGIVKTIVLIKILDTLENNEHNSDYNDNMLVKKNTNKKVNKKVTNLMTNFKKVSCCNCLMWTIFIVAFVIAFLSALVLLTLVTLPIPQFEIQDALPTDIIIYQLPTSSFWLSNIQVELIGSGREPCTAKAVSAKCTNVQEEAMVSVTNKSIEDFLYIKERSVVNFITSSEINDCEYCVPYYVWMFTSIIEARANAIDNFNNFACSKPPHNVWCIEVTKSNVFIAPVSSYYFIRCDRDPNCTLLETIQINTTNYDFQLTESESIDSVVIQSGVKKNLQLKEGLISFDSAEVCVLMSLDSILCNHETVYHIDVNGTRRNDLLLFPSLVLCLSIIVVVICLVVFCCSCVMKKRHKK